MTFKRRDLTAPRTAVNPDGVVVLPGDEYDALFRAATKGSRLSEPLTRSWDVFPERIEEALAYADSVRDSYRVRPHAVMESDVVVLAAALREAQGNYATLLASHEATSETLLAAQAENERLREYVKNLGGWVATADEAKRIVPEGDAGDAA